MNTKLKKLEKNISELKSKIDYHASKKKFYESNEEKYKTQLQVIVDEKNKFYPYTLPKISPDQQNIINLLKQYNVIVNSVAGSGKTTTILHVAKQYKTKSILLLTYNARLKDETREKIKKLKLINIEAHSYHAFANKYYINECKTDSTILKIFKENMKCKQKLKYDIIILDEAQDMTKTFYELICKFYKDNNLIHSKFLLLGDYRQCIFQFNGADTRYMSYAYNILNFNNYSWKNASLSCTFRLTIPLTLFINKCVLHTNYLKSNKKSDFLPRYIICNSFNYPVKEVLYYIEECKYEFDDIFILAPSVRK